MRSSTSISGIATPGRISSKSGTTQKLRSNSSPSRTVRVAETADDDRSDPWRPQQFTHRWDWHGCPSACRCSACVRTSSCSRSSAPATRRLSASSTTATASGCSPTSARCCARRRARTPRTCCRTSSCAPTARCGPTPATCTCARGSTASPTTAASTTCGARCRRRPTSSRSRASRCTTRSRRPSAARTWPSSSQDVGRLPEHQRSALLMREIDGMSYADLAGALDVTVPAVKSLLVRARIGLVEAAEARDADCAEIRHDLADELRPRRQGLRARAPPHADLRWLPRVPHRSARHPPLVRRAQPAGRRPAGDGRREAARLRRRRRRRRRGRLRGDRRRRGRRPAAWRP